jgi:hypothetical protein
MNVRIFAVAAAALTFGAALTSACGAPDLVVPQMSEESSVPMVMDACSDAASNLIRGNTGAQGDGGILIACNGGNVVMLDHSEGLCDGAFGYLICAGSCYSEFSCEKPDGAVLVQLDGAPVDLDAEDDVESKTDAKHADAGVDAKAADVEIDTKPGDAAVDAKAADAEVDANEGDADAAAKPDAPSDAPLDTADAALADAPAG